MIWRRLNISSFHLLLGDILWQKFLVIQIHNSKGSKWSGDLLKTFIYSNFDTMGVSKIQKLNIQHKKLLYFCHITSQNIVSEEMKRTYFHNGLKLCLREDFILFMHLLFHVMNISWKYRCMKVWMRLHNIFPSIVHIC